MSFPDFAPSMASGCTPLASAREILWRTGQWLWKRLVETARPHPRDLRLCESVLLGDRRFVAVIAYGQSRFLLGATSASLVLLAKLEDAAGLPAVSDSIGSPHSSREPRA